MYSIAPKKSSLVGFGCHVRSVLNNLTGKTICHFNDDGDIYVNGVVKITELSAALKIIESEKVSTRVA